MYAFSTMGQDNEILTNKLGNYDWSNFAINLGGQSTKISIIRKLFTLKLGG